MVDMLTLLIMFVILVIAAIINTIVVYLSVNLARVEYPDYRQIFKIIFGYYVISAIGSMIFMLIGLRSYYFYVLLEVVGLIALVYVLVKVMIIQELKSIISFVGVSFCFSLIIRIVMNLFFKLMDMT